MLAIKGHILALLTIMVWGVTLVSTKVLLAFMSPLEIIVYRFMIAFLCLAVIYPKNFGFGDFKDEKLFALLGLTGQTIYFLLENQALNYTLTANVGVFAVAVPIITALLAKLFGQDEKQRSGFVVGLITALVGALIVVLNGTLNFKVNPLGDLMAFAACISFATYSLLIRKIDSRFNVLYVTRKMFFYGIVFTIPFIPILGIELNPSKLINPTIAFNILFLGVIASCACFAMWNKAVELIGAIKTSNYVYLVPVINIITAILVLGDKMTFMIGLGCFLTIIGVYISENGIKFISLTNNRKHDDIEKAPQ